MDTPTIDHFTAAETILADVERVVAEHRQANEAPPNCAPAYARAQVHATLALAEAITQGQLARA